MINLRARLNLSGYKVLKIVSFTLNYAQSWANYGSFSFAVDLVTSVYHLLTQKEASEWIEKQRNINTECRWWWAKIKPKAKNEQWKSEYKNRIQNYSKLIVAIARFSFQYKQLFRDHYKLPWVTKCDLQQRALTE